MDVRFVMDEDALSQVFLPVLRYSPVMSFQQCSIPTFIYTLIVPQRQEVEASEPANTVMLYRIPKCTGHKCSYFRVIIYKICIS